MPVTIPATGSGTATPIVSTDNITADSSQVQNVQLVGVSGGALTRVVVAADGSLEAGPSAAAGNRADVASSASDVTILAANTSRECAAVYNDSTAVLYLLVGTGTSSASNFTVRLLQTGYYEVPAGYKGIIKGIWASANGFARVTEWV